MKNEPRKWSFGGGTLESNVPGFDLLRGEALRETIRGLAEDDPLRLALAPKEPGSKDAMTTVAETPMLERAARAAWAAEWEEPFPRAGTIQHALAVQVATAVIRAVREPSGEMMQAGNRMWLDDGNERQIFEAMIDAALEA